MGDWEPLPDDPIWTLLRDRVVAYLSELGPRYEHYEGDWYLLDEDTGQQMVKIELVNNDLLRPDIVKSLQALLKGYPDWAIALQVDGVDADGQRRGMGLWIEEDKVSDELLREYLPQIFREMRF
jgi:hypothetical protein